MGEQRVDHIGTVGDVGDRFQEVIVRKLVEVGLHFRTLERNLVEGQVGVKQHVEETVEDVVAVGGIFVERKQPDAVSGEFLLAGELVVAHVAAHGVFVLAFRVVVLAMVLAIVGNLMRQHEGQFRLVGHLRQHPHRHQDGTVRQRVGVHQGALQDIDVDFLLQLRVVDQQLLFDVVEILVHLGAVEDSALIEHGDEKQVVFLVRLRGVRGLLQVGGETALRLYRRVVVDRELRLGETRDRTQNQKYYE